MHVKVQAGAEFDTVTPHELHNYMSGQHKAQMERMRGIKFRRLPPMNGVVTAGASVQIGGDTPAGATASQPQFGPSSGHLWVLRYVAVNGLATADVLSLNILGAADPDFTWWNFTGANFAMAWGKNEIWVEGGEYMQFAGTGLTAAAGSRIRVRGMVQQVPMELAAELI